MPRSQGRGTGKRRRWRRTNPVASRDSELWLGTAILGRRVSRPTCGYGRAIRIRSYLFGLIVYRTGDDPREQHGSEKSNATNMGLQAIAEADEIETAAYVPSSRFDSKAVPYVSLDRRSPHMMPFSMPTTSTVRMVSKMGYTTNMLCSPWMEIV